MFVLRPLDQHIDRLGACVFQLGLGLRYIDRRGHSALVAVLRKLQSLFEGCHVRIQQLLFRIQRPHLEVVEREFGVQTQAHRFQIGRAGLGVRPARLPPCGVHVQTHPLRRTHPTGITRSVAFVWCEVRDQGAVLRQMFACGRRARSHRGIVSRAVEPHQRPRLPELRFRRLQILIGDIDLFFKRIQLRVLKNLPPLSARDLIAGLRRLPIRRHFFVARRRGRGRLCIARPDGAAGQEKQTRQKRWNSVVGRRTSVVGSKGPRSRVRGPKSEVRLLTVPPAVFGRSARFRQSTTESGGFTMTFSLPFRPATTSTSLPKSWPIVICFNCYLLIGPR